MIAHTFIALAWAWAANAIPFPGPPPQLQGGVGGVAGQQGGGGGGMGLVQPVTNQPLAIMPAGGQQMGAGQALPPAAVPTQPGQQVGQQPPVMPGQQQQQPGLGAPLPPTTTPLMMPTVSSCAAVPLGAKVDCGTSGITPDECIAKQCCFDMTDATSPWCYFPAQLPGSTMPGAPGTAGSAGGMGGGQVVPGVTCQVGPGQPQQLPPCQPQPGPGQQPPQGVQ